MKIFLVLFIIGYCFAQDTKLTTSSTLTSKPDDKSSIGKWKNYENYFKDSDQYLKKWISYFKY